MALPATQLLGSLLFQVSATDLTVFSVVGISLISVGLAAGFIPAMRTRLLTQWKRSDRSNSIYGIFSS